MIKRKEILAYVKKKYGAEPDFPWGEDSNYAVLRHNENRKWFGLVFDITEDKLGLVGDKLIDALNVKCDPFLIRELRNEPGIFPAYHMNKEHWITVVLDGSCPKERVFGLIDISYDLAKPKKGDLKNGKENKTTQ